MPWGPGTAAQIASGVRFVRSFVLLRALMSSPSGA
jgi:hypothetical protein